MDPLFLAGAKANHITGFSACDFWFWKENKEKQYMD